MSAAAKGATEKGKQRAAPRAPELVAGAAAVPGAARRFHPSPGIVVAGAAHDALSRHPDAGPDGDLIILAVPAGRGVELLDALAGVLDVKLI